KRPADDVVERARRQIVEPEAGSRALGLVVLDDGIRQTPGGADDRQRSVPQAIELVQAAGLETRWHQEEIGSGFDSVSAWIVESDEGVEAVGPQARHVGKV